MISQNNQSRNIWVKRVIIWLGYTILFACVGFLLLRIWEIRKSLSFESLGLETLVLIVLCGVSFAISQFLLSTAWRFLLMWWGVNDLKLSWCHSIYGRTQIAKYLPGNVFHFASRQVVGKYCEGSQAAIAGASLYEILGLLITSGLMALAGMAYYHLPQSTISTETLVAMVSIAVLAIIVISLCAQRLAIIKGIYPSGHKKSSVFKQLVPAYSCYAIFFILYSGHMSLLVDHISGIDFVSNFGRLLTVVSIAWLAGYITPGSPGGLGVREALLVLGLSPIMGESDAIIAAFALRLVTVLGDLFFFLVALKIPLPVVFDSENGAADDKQAGSNSAIQR